MPAAETREAYLSRAQREWGAAVADFKALGWTEPSTKRGTAATRDFYVLAERVVLHRSWAEFSARCFKDSADGTTARNAVDRTARRIGLTILPA